MYSSEEDKDIVRRVFEDGAFADRALRSESARLDDRDRALAQQLAYGSVQRVRTLDHAIETLGRRPVRKLDPPVRAALRLGCYQLAFLDGVPRYAAVNESVELVREARLEVGTPGGEAKALVRERDYVARAQMGTGTSDVTAPVVYVGHGIVAPEYQWDDLSGVDLAGLAWNGSRLDTTQALLVAEAAGAVVTG